MEQMLKRVENLLLKYRVGRCAKIEPREIADMIIDYFIFEGILSRQILKDAELKGEVIKELSAGLYISF